MKRPPALRTRLRAVRALAICASASLAPRVALACSVCTAGREDETQTAFRLSTLFLSVLPLSMFGGFALFVWRRHRSRERARTQLEAGAGG